MAKFSLSNVLTLIGINANFQKVEDELNNKVLYRNNPVGEPNTMEVPLDMNGNDVFNVNSIGVQSLLVNGQDITEAVSESLVARDQAVAAAISAHADALTASSSATIAVNAANTASAIVGSGSFTQDGTGAILRSNQQKNREFASVTDYGAVGDGVTDDTLAFQRALNAKDLVYIPPSPTAYIVGDVTVPTGKALFSFFANNYSSFGTKAIVRRKAGATNVFNISGSFNNRFSGFTIDGVDRVTNGISGGGNHTNLDFMSIHNCNFGIGDVNYCRTVKSVQTNFFGNNIGIRNPIDSIFIGGYAAANKNHGISCLTGSNDNQFIAMKLEFNENYGADINGGENIHIDAIYDRNFFSGVHVAATSKYVKLTGEFRRNGRNNVSGQNSHIRFDGTISNIDIDAISRTGVDDGGGGPLTPACCLDVGAATVTQLTVKGDMTGFVTQPIIGSNLLTSVDWKAWGNDDIIAGRVNNRDSQGNHFSKGTVSIPTATTGNIPLTLPATSTFSRTLATLAVVGRNTTSGVTYAGNFNVVISREGAGASFLQSTISGEIGTAGVIQFGAGTLNLSVTGVATDGSTLTLNINNTVGNTVQFTARLR